MAQAILAQGHSGLLLPAHGPRPHPPWPAWDYLPRRLRRGHRHLPPGRLAQGRWLRLPPTRRHPPRCHLSPGSPSPAFSRSSSPSPPPAPARQCSRTPSRSAPAHLRPRTASSPSVSPAPGRGRSPTPQRRPPRDSRSRSLPPAPPDPRRPRFAFPPTPRPRPPRPRRTPPLATPGPSRSGGPATGGFPRPPEPAVDQRRGTPSTHPQHFPFRPFCPTRPQPFRPPRHPRPFPFPRPLAGGHPFACAPSFQGSKLGALPPFSPARRARSPLQAAPPLSHPERKACGRGAPGGFSSSSCGCPPPRRPDGAGGKCGVHTFRVFDLRAPPRPPAPTRPLARPPLKAAPLYMSTPSTTSPAQTHPSPRPVGPLVPRAPVATPAGQPAPILISDTDAPFPAHGTACSVCLTPVSGTGPRRHRPTAWLGCGHWRHFSCLARVRARTAPPRCPQCRAPWLTTLDDSLSQRCHQAALNPFQDSEHSEPEPPHPAPFSPIPTPTPPRTTPTATWQDRGRAAGPVTTDANSWLYVPLLHAGTGALTPAALRAWQQHPLCDDWWDRARIALHTAGPVPVPAILNALDLSPHHDAAIARAALAAAAAGLPPGAQVHLPWVLHRLMHPDDTFNY